MPYVYDQSNTSRHKCVENRDPSASPSKDYNSVTPQQQQGANGSSLLPSGKTQQTNNVLFDSEQVMASPVCISDSQPECITHNDIGPGLRADAPVFIPCKDPVIAAPNAGTGAHILAESTDEAHTHTKRRVTLDFDSIINVGKASTETAYDKMFDSVRATCAMPSADHAVGPRAPDPFDLADHRRNNWPQASELPSDMLKIYNDVRQSGLPNYLGIRTQLSTSLNIDRWDTLFGQYDEFREMLGFVKYGFPMGYMGPTSDLNVKYNHPSATSYPYHIDSFIEKEIALGGVIGAFDKPPFAPWVH